MGLTLLHRRRGFDGFSPGPLQASSVQIVPRPTQPHLQAEDLAWLTVTPFGCYACQRIAGPFISYRGQWMVRAYSADVITGCERQSCVNGDWLCQWEMAIFDPTHWTQNPHPLTDHQKIWYRWLCRRPLRLCQIWCKSVYGGFWANGWNITKMFFYLTIFIRPPYSRQTQTDRQTDRQI